jgi:hypothetical protein
LVAQCCCRTRSPMPFSVGPLRGDPAAECLIGSTMHEDVDREFGFGICASLNILLRASVR